MNVPTTATTLDTTAHAVIYDIADQFQHSWNVADADAYAEPFADDADYVTIQGTLIEGRAGITAGAAEIFATIYRDSSIALRVTGVRCVSPSVIVAQIEHRLDVPAGPLAGTHDTLATIVVVDTVAGWEVTTLHNTLVAAPGPA